MQSIWFWRAGALITWSLSGEGWFRALDDVIFVHQMLYGRPAIGDCVLRSNEAPKFISSAGTTTLRTVLTGAIRGQEFAGLRSSTVTIPTRKSGSQQTLRWRERDSNVRSPLDASGPQLSLDCVRAAARPTRRPCDLDRRVGSLRREDFLEVFMRQIAPSTVTRARWSTFGHDPGL
jgi:hypothetical protein